MNDGPDLGCVPAVTFVANGGRFVVRVILAIASSVRQVYTYLISVLNCKERHGIRRLLFQVYSFLFLITFLGEIIKREKTVLNSNNSLRPNGYLGNYHIRFNIILHKAARLHTRLCALYDQAAAA